ncbi:MAG TPA: aminoglycoside phosphotransferase family protein [Methylomirabilota bacterium]|nr:aminoglycoside phosphotransferase family protein [Methylomirabilota bacterium]
MKKRSVVTAKTAVLILEHHFGKRPQTVKRIHGGIANHVFEARIGRDDLVLRISEKPHKLQVFMKEQWAVSAARKNKVPTPEILEVCNDVLGLPYMISRHVPGRPAGTIGLKKADVLRQLGEYTAIINTIKTHDFGHIFDWSPNKLSRHGTWKEYVDQELKVDERLEALARFRMLKPARLKKLFQQVASIRLWTAPPTLTHGDIRLKNVMLDEKRKIVALLDWEDCTSNIAPYWELSIALHDLTIDEKQIFLEAYGLDMRDYMRMAPAIHAFNILNYLGAIQRAAQRKDTAQLLNLRARLNGAFDLYSL